MIADTPEFGPRRLAFAAFPLGFHHFLDATLAVLFFDQSYRVLNGYSPDSNQKKTGI
jgi:hypothetical protein